MFRFWYKITLMMPKKLANSGCDGIVIGSAFVKYIQDNIDEKNLPQFVR